MFFKKTDIKFNIVLIHLILACIFTYFYSQLVASFPLKKFDEKFREVEDQISVVLPGKVTYLLKVWGDSKPVQICLNNEPLIHFFFRDRGEIQEYYYVLSKNLIRDGKNVIKITSNIDYSVRIKNSINFNSFSAVLLKPVPSQKEPIFLKILPIFLVLLILQFFLWLMYFFVSKKFFGIFFERYSLGYFLTFMPAFLFFLIAEVVSLFSPFSIVIFKLGFIKAFIGLVLLFQAPWFILMVLKRYNYKDNVRNPTFELKKHVLFSQNISINKFLSRIEDCWFIQWFMVQKFSDKGIFLFLFLLFLSSLFLIFHITIISEFFSVIGFLFLFSAVIIKFRQAG